MATDGDLRDCPTAQNQEGMLGTSLDISNASSDPIDQNSRNSSTDDLPCVAAPGLLSLCLFGWEKPWSSREFVLHRTPRALGMLGNSNSPALNKTSSHQSNTRPGPDLLSEPLILGSGSRMDLHSVPLIPPPGFTPGCSLQSCPRPGASLVPIWNLQQQNLDLHFLNILSVQRQAASVTWSGVLLPRLYTESKFSRKVFLGGLQWDMNEAKLIETFKPFGLLKVVCPLKNDPQRSCRGFAYLILNCEQAVHELLRTCTMKSSGGSREYFFSVGKKGVNRKEVQVVPWAVLDSTHRIGPAEQLDIKNSIHVEGLHGKLNAEALSIITNDLFGGVVFVGMDTDENLYPIGSARVFFSNRSSYMKAVNAAVVEISTPSFVKKVKIEPYLEAALCQMCCVISGPFFCRELTCFKYYCMSCWRRHHSIGILRVHSPLVCKRKEESK